MLAAAVPLLAGPSMAAAAPVVISEFRPQGPNGGNDEFVEMKNTTAAAIDISGWKLVGCAATSGNPSNRATVAAGTTLPAGARFLFTNTASGGYSGSVPGDATYGTGISNSTGSGLRIENASGTVIDTIGNGTSPCRETTGLSFTTFGNVNSSFERLGAGADQDTDNNAADFTVRVGSNPQNCGTACIPPPPPCPATPAVTPIGTIQGAGDVSECDGLNVTIEGVVTGIDDEVGRSTAGQIFRDDRGIFVQQEAPDGDPATSEGVFVGYVDDPAPLLGKRVRVNGKVREKFGMTQIDETINQEPTVLGDGTVPAPVTLDPVAAAAQTVAADGSRSYYERFEGMRVRLAQGTANSGGTSKFGELFLTPGPLRDRVFRTETQPDLIGTDADAGAGNPANPARPAAPSTTVVNANLFQRVSDVVGPLVFSFTNYKIMVQEDALPTVGSGPIRFPSPALALNGKPKDRLRIASFNVENFFPVGGDLDGGPVTQAEYEDKRDSIVAAIQQRLVNPDIVAVQEVVDKTILEDVATRTGYTAYLEEGNDNRGIDVGFLVAPTLKVESVTQLGKTATESIPGTSCSDITGNLFDRPPLEIAVKTGPFRLRVITNHFASKAAPDSCRDAQAAFVRDRVAALEAQGVNVVVTGDLNAFEDETPLGVLEGPQTSLDNLWDTLPAELRYSFAFQGKLQTLDHILITSGLQSRVDDFDYAHFDNDYYDRDRAGDSHKLSDHDPPVLSLLKTAPSAA